MLANRWVTTHTFTVYLENFGRQQAFLRKFKIKLMKIFYSDFHKISLYMCMYMYIALAWENAVKIYHVLLIYML